MVNSNSNVRSIFNKTLNDFKFQGKLENGSSVNGETLLNKVNGYLPDLIDCLADLMLNPREEVVPPTPGEQVKIVSILWSIQRDLLGDNLAWKQLNLFNQEEQTSTEPLPDSLLPDEAA